MAQIARFRKTAEDQDYWPAFVDALGNLLIVTIFLVTLFSIAQYALGFLAVAMIAQWLLRLAGVTF